MFNQNHLSETIILNVICSCYVVLKIIPLRAEQVSEANLRSEQGVINFTPFVLSIPYANKKKKKLNFPYGWGSAQKFLSVCLSVCLLSVCLSVTSLSPIIFWTIGLIFFTKTRENVYLRILILKFRGQDPTVKALG